MSPHTTEIQSVSQFDTLVRSLPPAQLLVLDFHAVWCGPCHAIAPVYDGLAQKFPHVKFVKIDVDQLGALAQRYRVTAMPTFKFLKAGQVIDEIRGASPPQLTALVTRYAGPVPKPSATPTPTGATSSSKPVDSTVSLLPFISAKGLSCLNESKEHPLSSIVGPDAGPKGRSYLESDVDPELLISLHFNEPVKLKSIAIFGGVSPSQAPKSIRLYVNQNSLDFGDVENLVPSQELQLSGEDIRSAARVDLRYVRFQNVRNLHICVKDNQEGDETTRIDSIDIFGIVG